jgi:hypothetical protein
MEKHGNEDKRVQYQKMKTVSHFVNQKYFLLPFHLQVWMDSHHSITWFAVTSLPMSDWESAAGNLNCIWCTRPDTGVTLLCWLQPPQYPAQKPSMIQCLLGAGSICRKNVSLALLSLSWVSSRALGPPCPPSQELQTLTGLVWVRL